MSEECEYHHGTNPECPMCWTQYNSKAASSFAAPAGSMATCEQCKGTGIDQTEHCEGRLTGMTCDCPLGHALMEEHYKNHPEDR